MTSPTESMQVSEVSVSGTTSIDALLGGTKWGGAQGLGASISYSFPYANGTSATWAANYSSDNEPASATAYRFSASHQAAAQGALQQWANVAGLTFSPLTETSSNVGDLRFAFTDAVSNSNWGWAYFPTQGATQGGDIWINPDPAYSSTEDWSVGSFNFSSLLHETGHALGLKHSFEGAAVLPASQDSTQYTVMSYTEHPYSYFREVTDNGGGSYSWTYYNVQPQTPMLYDISVMQYLYGANQTYNTGNDTYSFDPNTPFLMTIWDAGGTDTVSVSNFTKSCTLDLRAGTFSKVSIDSDPLPAGATPYHGQIYDGTDNLAIAYGVTIENAIGGSGDDTLTGNAASNTVHGGLGNDTLDGQAGIDTATYSASHATCTVTLAGSGGTVSSAADGTDSLSNIERLQFADKKIAIDLDGAAGNTARLIAAAFGEPYLIPALIGIGLSVFDAGLSKPQVAELALGSDLFLQLAGSRDNTAVVTQLYRSVVGVPPPATDLATFVGMLTAGMSQADLLVLAADTEITAQNIDLLGLAQTGIEFV